MSIIMPTYNAGARIGAAISGVLTQTYPDIELIVVDDGSTDDTHAVATGFGDRVTVIKQQNAGPNAARNNALRHASGEFVALCDSDDYLLPNYVADAVSTLKGSPARTWVTCAAMSLADTGLESYGYSPFGEIPRAAQREAILQANFVSIFSVFPKEMADEIGQFSEELHRCEDWQYWARAILSGWRVAFQPRTAALYRQQGPSQSSDRRAMLDAEDEMFARLQEEFAGTFTAAERELLATRAKYGSAQRQIAEARAAWARGDFAGAAQILRRVASRYPLYRDQRIKAVIASAAAPVLSRMPAGSGVRRRLQDRWS